MDVKVDVSKFEHNVDQLQSGTKKNDVKVLFINITNYSAKIQFTICCIAVFVLYVIYGYLQELIFTLEGFKPYGWYLTLVQFFLYTTFACVECTFTRTTTRRIPLRVYCLLAGLTLGTIGFSNASLSYLNYPTQVIFKCCKLIPVMFGSILIQKKKYKMIDFLACIFMCIGLSCFTLADSRVSPNFSSFGVTLISCALLCDAIIGNVQEKSMKAYFATNVEVVFYSYAIGFVYLAVIMVLSGSLQTGYNFCSDKPLVYFYALIFSMAGYLGVQVVLTLVKTCGALAAVTVTTCRKAVSIVISFLFFSKPFTMHYVWAGGLVVLGIYFSFLSKNNIGSSNLSLSLKWLKFVTRRHYKKSLETTV
ncbi:adenosine 3'-phospho 5'-phosphosulfate transporter 2 [Rhodnius prolixus]|uniref:adenosine 3'-phospho 5'-phosphosulfate transporter 2 n=1 Tax=Rhodnius prolixus TaxID=13249 RepID=UPI003D18CA34